METEAAADDAAATEKAAGTDDPAPKKQPKLQPQKQAGGLAIALTALRPQERQALHRPPIPPPLPQRQAPRSPSPAPI